MSEMNSTLPVEGEEDEVLRMKKRLEKMGQANSSKKKGSLRKKADNAHLAKNHRFIRDGQVQVEKHTLSRVPHAKENNGQRAGEERHRGVQNTNLIKFKKRHLLLQKQYETLSEDHRRLKSQYNELETMIARQKKNLTNKEMERQKDQARISGLEGRLNQRDETISSLRKELLQMKRGFSKPELMSRGYTQPSSPSGRNAQPIKWW